MRTFLGLIVAPSLALACQSLMFSLVTPSCSVQTRVALHAVAFAVLAAELVLTLLAHRQWTSIRAAGDAPDAGVFGPTRHAALPRRLGHRRRGALGPAGPGDVVCRMGAVSLLRLTPLLLLPGIAAAHVPEATAPSPSLWQWNLEPWLLALLLGSAALYAQGIRRLWRSAGPGRGIAHSAVVAFALGWLTLVVALVSPLDPLGGRLFSAHMVQHELLMVVAAPLLVMGRPLAAWTWAFEPGVRQALGRTAQAAPIQVPWQILTDPVVAWAPARARALGLARAELLRPRRSSTKACTSCSTRASWPRALFFWWAVLGHDPRRTQGTGQAIGLLFTTMLHTAALGALLSLAPTPWYAPYIATSNALGMDPVDDQQLGGLVMWVPAGLAYVVVALVLLGRLLVRQGREGRPRVP